MSKTCFSQTQASILNKLLTQCPENQKTQYKKITQKFNDLCDQQIINHEAKSCRAIQLKIKNIFEIKKHVWNTKLDQLMLDQVSQGKKWRQIAKLQQFKKESLSSEKIKRKFQCESRNKFKTLYREVYRAQISPHVSDPTLKCLLQIQKIEQLQKDLIITSQEKRCLLSNIQLFKASIHDENDKRQIRSSKIKCKILNLVSSDFPLYLLVSTILKIQNSKKKIKFSAFDSFIQQNEATMTSKPSQTDKTNVSISSNGDINLEDYLENLKKNIHPDDEIFEEDQDDKGMNANLNYMLPFEGNKRFYMGKQEDGFMKITQDQNF